MSSSSLLSPPHFISVVRLADASTSSTTTAADGEDDAGKKLATFAVQIATQSNAKNYVAKCRNGLQNRKIKKKTTTLKETKMKEKLPT